MPHVLLAVLLALPSLAFAQDEEIIETKKIREETNHDVVVANTLWDLAEHYYKNPWMWPTIYEANKATVKNPHWIYPNQVLIIPGLGRTVTVVKTRSKPKPEPKPEPKPKPPAPEPKLPEFDRTKGRGAIVLPDALSVEMPRGMTAQQPSMFRMRMPDNWAPDGEVLEYQGRESMAAAGDKIRIRIDGSGPVRRRQNYSVYRWSGPTEADVQREGNYVVKVGLVEVVRKLSDTDYLAVIVDSGGSIQLGDILQLEQ